MKTNENVNIKNLQWSMEKEEKNSDFYRSMLQAMER